MLVEATLDFPEEELDFLQQSDATGRLARIRGDLDQLLKQARQGALLRDGLNVVLVGAPNVGKSSLMNALAGADIAIVTAIPGTTRDRIAQQIDVDGIPLNVIDTAGLREATDEVERLGIARTWAEIERADVVVHLVDATSSVDDAAVLEQRHRAHGPARPAADGCQQDRPGARRGACRRRACVLVGQDRRRRRPLRDELKRVAGWDQETRASLCFWHANAICGRSRSRAIIWRSLRSMQRNAMRSSTCLPRNCGSRAIRLAK